MLVDSNMSKYDGLPLLHQKSETKLVYCGGLPNDGEFP